MAKKAISPELQKAWDRFKNNANFSGLHPLDEDRFYQVLAIARNDGHILGDELIDALYPGEWEKMPLKGDLIDIADIAEGLLDVVEGKGRRA